MRMNPADYDAWYDAPRGRGRWLGNTEYELLSDLLMSEPGGNLLDIGCGRIREYLKY